MLNFLKNLVKRAPTNQLIKVEVRKGTSVVFLEGKQGENLMDLTNKIVNADSNIYGLCDKQLACTTCSVNIKSHHFKLLPQPKEEETDVLVGLTHYKPNETRMACQIFLKPKLNGMIIEIPKGNIVV